MRPVQTTVKIIRKPIGLLTIDPNNPNYMTAKQRAQLVESLTKYGIVQPIIVDRDNVVINGNQKVEAIKSSEELSKLHAEVPCVVMDDLSEDDRLLLQQALNKISGVHDRTKDHVIFNKLMQGNSGGTLAKLLGRSENSIISQLRKAKETRALWDAERAAKEDGTAPKPKTKQGEIYLLGRHYLYVGDCMEGLPKLIDDAHTPHCIFTDPPYGVDYSQGKYSPKTTIHRPNIRSDKYGTAGTNQVANDTLGDFTTLTTRMFEYLGTALKGDVSVYCFTGSLGNFCTTHAAMEKAGFAVQCVIIWDKGRPILGRSDYQWAHENMCYGRKGKPYWNGDRNETTVWHVSHDTPPNKYLHPTQKPIELAKRAIMNSVPVDNNGIVCDPFAGAGMTVLAAEACGVTALACELEPKYADVIVDRWQAMTGKKAEKV